LRHPKTPWPAKAILWLAIGYLVMPFDLIPDFIPVLGQLDELVILPGLVYLALKLTPDEIVAECRATMQNNDNSEDGKPKND
jgi:carbonic anhydrase